MTVARISPRRSPLAKLSLRAVLMLGAVLAAVVPAATLAVREVWVGPQERQHEQIEANRVLAEALAGSVDQFLQGPLGAVRAAAAAAAEGPLSPTRLGPTLGWVVGNSPAIESIVVVDAAGFSVAFHPAARARTGDGLGVSFADRGWFQEIARTRQPLADRTVATDRITGRPTIAIRAPILGPSGAFRGVVAAALDLSRVLAVVSPPRLGASGQVVVMAADGRVLAPPGVERVATAAPPGEPAWATMMARDTGPLPSFRDAGEQRVGAFATVRTTGWKVVATQSLDEAQSLAHDHVWMGLSGAGLVFLVAAGPMLLVAALLARPLRALVAATRRVGMGELATRVAVPAGPAEVHELVQAFNQMAEALESTESRLREAEVDQRTAETRMRLASIVESSNDAIIAETVDGVISSWNAAAEAMYGYAAGEIIGQPVSILTAPAHRGDTRHVLEQLARGEPVRQLETVHVRKDGTHLDVSLTISAIRNAAGRIVGASTIARDVTDLRRTARVLERAHRALRVLGAGGESLVRARVESELVQEICRLVVEVGGYRLAWVGYCEHDPGRTVRPVARAGDAGYVDEIRVSWADDLHGRGPVGTAIRTGATAVVQRVAEDPQFEPWRAAATRHGFGSVLGVPLRQDGTAFGALAIYAAEPDAFDAEATELLRRLADDFAYGILALRAREEQRRADGERRQALQLLRQRVKELTVVRETAHLLQQGILSDAQLLQAAADALPRGYQYPDVAEARVVFAGMEGRTPGFVPTPWTLRARWQLGDGAEGTVEVAYREERPAEVEGPFLGEERDLITTVADMLRTYFERQRAEGALRRSEGRFRALIENAQDIITVLDARGVVLYESPAIEQVLGYRTEELVGRSAFELLHPGDDRAVVELFTSGAAIPGQAAALEFRFRHKDGSWRVLHGIGKNCLDDPAVRGVVVNSRDVTERRRAEQELAKQRDALMQSDKLAAMSAILAGVAHELNNPLAVVVGRAALLGQQLAGGPLEAPVGKLVQAAERCARIVKNFLALARQHPPERQRVHLNQVVQEALELVAYALRVDNVDVALDLSPGLPVLWADPHQLHQVVVNLVSNAHHAMRELPPSHPRRLTLRTRADAGVATLEVSDTGPGIPRDVQARLFEPFFTTKPVGQGTGLGLSLCRGIVESHGGRITFESEPGQGAIFRVELPVQAAPEASLPAAGPAVERAAGHRHILVVDDEAEVAQVVADVLERDGQRVEMVGDGRAALEKLRSAPFDLIVSDIKMPELDGPGLYREVARLQPALARRMVFLTGDTLGPDVQRFLEDAGTLWIAKPFAPDDLRRIVGQALRGTAA